jgi:hypothetical protein
VHNNVAAGSSLLVALSMACLSMKMHSFFWYKYQRLKAQQQGQRNKPLSHHGSQCHPEASSLSPPSPSTASIKDACDSHEVVSIGKYFYFLCTPCLLYADHFPRTFRVRYHYAARELVACVGCFIVMHIVGMLWQLETSCSMVQHRVPCGLVLTLPQIATSLSQDIELVLPVVQQVHVIPLYWFWLQLLPACSMVWHLLYVASGLYKVQTMSSTDKHRQWQWQWQWQWHGCC